MTLSRRTRWVLLAVLLCGTGIAVFFYLTRPPKLPDPTSPEYKEYVRSFQLGVAALDAGRDDLAREKLTHAAELIPEEPAAWANLGLLHLRKNELEKAAAHLKKAHELAPKNGAIEALLAGLAEKQGRQTEAVAHYRKAAETQPREVALLYSLAQAISKQAGANSDAEYQQILERIFKLQPTNLRVLVQRAGFAFRLKDKEQLRDSLERLAKLAPAWKPEPRQVLDELRKAVMTSPGEVPLLLQDLDNVLKAERSYSRDSRMLVPVPGMVGAPLYHFVLLASPRSTPAAPDADLTFETSAMSPEKERFDVVRLVWLLDEKKREALVSDAIDGGATPRPGETFTAAVFGANGNGVRRLDAPGMKLPFPGGPKAIAPSAFGLLPVDWDNDFRMDLVLAGAGGLRFWQQQAGGNFLDVSAKTGLPPDVLDGNHYGVWAADFEMDGDLDLLLAPRLGRPLLLRNNRDGTFKVLEPFAGVNHVRGVEWADLDNDGACDAIFLDSKGALHGFANERSGQFASWPMPDNLGAIVALTIADMNSDGTFDVVALNSDGAIVRISTIEGSREFQVAELGRAEGKGGAAGEAGLHIEDFDNNGAVDVLVSSPSKSQFFLGDEQGKLVSLKHTLPIRTSGVVDLDRDGRLDLIGVEHDGKPVKAINHATKKYHWQAVWALANPKAGDDRINSFSLGGEVEIRAGLLVQKQPVRGPVIHFGLGDNEAVDVTRIVWPNGVPQWEFEIPADRFIVAAQRLSGSCPFLFTWDGSEMRFAGDFMWGTPLGMYINGQNIGDFPQTTEWLKIPGEHLVPRDGVYDVRVQANLWEVDYFDKLALIVVDHPAETEVHVEERFFLKPTPPRLHLTTPARPVQRARDHLGKDVTDIVKAIDGRYLDSCGRGRFQGLTNDHWVEVELGDETPREGPVLLVARGWLHPTNSSINVALSQGKHDAPRPLSLEIPDGAGGWKTVMPALGFPAGKNKTMLIRLDGLDGKEAPKRFRLRTNMEIYWDYLGVARELDPSLVKLQRPTPLSVELRQRGILEMTRKDKSSPEVPVYDTVTRVGQPWRDLTGYYTRFGEVQALVKDVDDRYVIANAGDEIAFRYPVPDGPGKGWKRDFIWEADGWTRDGDLNTRFGNMVLPLPAHGVDADKRLPTTLKDDPVYRRFPEDWRIYHTRFISGEEFSRGLRK